MSSNTLLCVKEVIDKYEKLVNEASNAMFAKDYDKALSIIDPLLKKDVAGAYGLLGLMYQTGLGKEVDGKLAVEYLLKAVELRDGTTAHNLGTVYIAGIPGVERDDEKSKRYYQLAKKMGAQYGLDEFYE